MLARFCYRAQVKAYFQFLQTQFPAEATPSGPSSSLPSIAAFSRKAQQDRGPTGLLFSLGSFLARALPCSTEARQRTSFKHANLQVPRSMAAASPTRDRVHSSTFTKLSGQAPSRPTDPFPAAQLCMFSIWHVSSMCHASIHAQLPPEITYGLSTFGFGLSP